ncbi:hypothetical protein ACQKNO_26010 [Bacillus paramycoides]|uniref:hypothetical protein n=1 Tax=Bacillus paramycoides TaxID=2026194 RepID=UPI003CFF2A7F
MKFDDVQVGTRVYYKPSRMKRSHPVNVYEKSIDPKDPYIIVGNTISESLFVGAGSLSTEPFENGIVEEFTPKTRHWTCFGCKTLLSKSMEQCTICQKIICPKCGRCHCKTIWDRNNNKRRR